jgi:hypothetical protein
MGVVGGSVLDFATVEDVEAWARAQPLGMGRLKVGLMVEQRRLTARGLEVAGQWLGPGRRAGPVEPVLLPEALPPVAAPPVEPLAWAPRTPRTDETSLGFGMEPAAQDAGPAGLARDAAPAMPAAPAARPARASRFRWLEAIAILLLLGLAGYLALRLAQVAGRM